MTETAGAATAPDATLRRARPAWQVLLAVAAIVLFGIALAWPWISGAVTTPWDAKAQFQPQLAFLANSFATGQSPAWNPFNFAGWPQVADPQSLIFVPPFVLLALFDPAPSFAAMDATLYATLIAGALGLVAFGRDRGWHPAGMAVAGLAFAFGGAAAWRIQHVGQVVSLAMLPIALFLIARALERRSFRYGAAAGMVAAFMVAGRDQVGLLGVYFLAGWAATEILAPRPGTRVGERINRAVRPIGAGTLVGLALIVVPVIMTLLLAADSNRPEIDYIGAGKGSLHPASLITAVVADLFGQGSPRVDYWGPPSEAFGVLDIYLAQNMAAFYAGAVPIVAILFLGLARGWLWRPGFRFMTVATLLTVIYAIGWYTPFFHPMFDYLPGVDLYRRPADATFLLGFEIALLGGMLVGPWLDANRPPTPRLQRLAQIAIAAAVLVALPLAFAVHADRVAEAIRPILIAVACIGGAVAALEAARRLDATRPALAILLLAGVTAIDLAWNNGPNESTALPPAVYDTLSPTTADPVIADLKARVAAGASADRRDRVELAGLGFHWPNAGMVHGLETTLGYNPLRLSWYQRATGAEDTVGLPDQRRFVPLMPSYSSTLANLLGLRWIAADVPLGSIDSKYDSARIRPVATHGKTTIYENPDALPRVLFASGQRYARPGSLISTGQWPEGFDPRREVVLYGPGTDIPVRPEGDRASVAIASYANGEVVVTVDTPVEGHVVLNDVWHPWWRAEVDGRLVAIKRANAIFRAVPVRAGRHEVRFSFRPVTGAIADLFERLKL